MVQLLNPEVEGSNEQQNDILGCSFSHQRCRYRNIQCSSFLHSVNFDTQFRDLPDVDVFSDSH